MTQAVTQAMTRELCHEVYNPAICQRDELRAEVERLTNAIRRIDGINDNPADYNPAINAVCDAILRPHFAAKGSPKL